MSEQPDAWPSREPEGCPFPRSTDLVGVRFTGRHAEYTNADTWYPTWALDGDLYSPWTDGEVGGWPLNSAGHAAVTAQARIVGDDPLALEVIPLNACLGSPLPYGGRYPCGSLVKDGIWYYGTYCLDETQGRDLNWDVLGPFVGFRVSRDLGATWEETPHTPAKPIFGESGKHNSKVKIGAPHFVDFGRDMEHSPDGKAYLVGHGATSSHADLSWISGDHVYLIRVDPTPETINDPDAYEFFAGTVDGEPRWTSDFSEIRPLIDWVNHCGCVTVTYDAPLGKYLMFVTDGWPTNDKMSSYVLEADALTGPWRLVVYMENFGEQAYFLNLPTKFVSPDGARGWLCFSANFTNFAKEEYSIWSHIPDIGVNPPHSRYAMCLQELELLRGPR